MGLEVLFWIWVLTWMTKTAATDVLHAVKGTANPRYELKKQRAAAAGQPVKGTPRYGTREWAGDLYSDALSAHTERRRQAAKVKAQPVDDMVDVVREPEWLTPARDEHLIGPRPVCPRCGKGRIISFSADGNDLCNQCGRMNDPNNTRNCPLCRGSVVVDGAPCPACLARQRQRNAEWEDRHETPEPVPPQPAPEPAPDTRPIAPVIPLFPNPKQIEKEITMATSEVTGLSTAIAFAEAAASAHNSFASGGSEGYTGALAQHGVGPSCIGSAQEAQEASSIAAAKWQKHKDDLAAQMNVKEAYQGTPDAGNKEFLLNG